MPAYRPPLIPAREITPKNIYLSRRGFTGTAAGLAAIGLSGREAVATPLAAKAGAYKLDEKLTRSMPSPATIISMSSGGQIRPEGKFRQVQAHPRTVKWMALSPNRRNSASKS